MQFDKELTQEYFSEIIDIITDEDSEPRAKAGMLGKVFRQAIARAVEHSHTFFPTDYSRIVFLADGHSFTKEFSARLFRALQSVRSLSKKNARPSDTDFAQIIATVSEFLSKISGLAVPDFLRPFEERAFQESADTFVSVTREKIEFLSAVVVAKPPAAPNQANEFASLAVRLEDGAEYELRLFGELREMRSYVWEGANINLFNVKFVKSRSQEYITTGAESLLAVEPDYLVDVTDISECFVMDGTNPFLYFLKRYIQKLGTAAMIKGNIVNSLFDDLITNPESNFDESFEKALRYKPLQVFALPESGNGALMTIKESVRETFSSMKSILPLLDAEYKTAEPTFISAKFGIQGRLDLLMEYAGDTRKKDIVELKSGRAPSKDITQAISDTKRVQTGVWPNHLAQTTCYNLLLDSAIEGRTGNSKILYSAAQEEPLRDTPNIPQQKQKVLSLRNKIVAWERSLSVGKYAIFDKLGSKCPYSVPPFSQHEMIEFEKVFTAADETERDYFCRFSSFIQNEVYSAKTGTPDGERRGGFAELWRSSLIEKEEAMNVLSNLVLIEEESDFEGMKLRFRRPESGASISSIRKGDIAILYPYSDAGTADPLNMQLIKCSIREISAESVTVSLRNKLFRRDVLLSSPLWVLEPDYMDFTSRSLFSSLFSLISSAKRKRDILLGRERPEFANRSLSQVDYLSEERNQILNRALSARDYFLIQGPPGTGKTSYMLRTLVETVFKDETEKILVLAYTNRAVDEICSAIKRISPCVPFLRLGGKESSEHTDVLISMIAENTSLADLYQRIAQTRVFVSTVSSISAQPEILSMHNFSTAIIDEAGQILEPQIVGLLTSVGRFIMIGDECQLPAIVLQSEAMAAAKSEPLAAIGLERLSGSLFERLAAQSRANGYEAEATLRTQARMHDQIQEFPNIRFYGGTLEIMDKDGWQRHEDVFFDTASRDPLEALLARNRVLLIESKPEKRSKIHLEEARRAAVIASEIQRKMGAEFDEKSIGVVAPWRAQCGEIIKRLPAQLSQKVSVDTIERYQGSERDTIVISYAINYAEQLPGICSYYSKDGTTIDRKLNVALTRARNRLIILANPHIISRSPIFRDLVDYIKSKGGYISDDEFRMAELPVFE